MSQNQGTSTTDAQRYTFQDLLDSLTGVEEDALALKFGGGLESLLLTAAADERNTGLAVRLERAVLFVFKLRELGSADKAFKHVQGLSRVDLDTESAAYIVDPQTEADEAEADLAVTWDDDSAEPVTERGKDVTASD